jgi:hypothetical protein
MSALESDTKLSESGSDPSLSRRARRGKRKRDSRSASPNGSDAKRFKEDPEPAKRVGPIVYVPGEALPNLEPYIGSTLEVLIPGEHVTLNNEHVMQRHVWGSHVTGEFTDDSDVVALLQLTGHVTLTDTPLAGHVIAVFDIAPGLTNYGSSERSNLRSKSWGKHHVTLKVKSVTLDGTALAPAVTDALHVTEKEDIALNRNIAEASQARELGARSRPKKVILSYDRDEASHFSLDILPDTIFQYSLSNEPCFKYHINLVCDRGVEPKQWTSFKLHKSVLYLEDYAHRYELSRTMDAAGPARYRWAQVLLPHRVTCQLMKTENVPLAANRVTVLEESIDWSHIQWANTTVTVAGTAYFIKKLFWVPIAQPLNL